MRAESDDVEVHLAAERAKMRAERAAVEAQEARFGEASSRNLEIEIESAQAEVAAEAALQEVAAAAAMLPSALPRYGSPYRRALSPLRPLSPLHTAVVPRHRSLLSAPASSSDVGGVIAWIEGTARASIRQVEAEAARSVERQARRARREIMSSPSAVSSSSRRTHPSTISPFLPRSMWSCSGSRCTAPRQTGRSSWTWGHTRCPPP